MSPQFDVLEREIERLEAKFRESTEELRALRDKFRLAARAEAEIKAEIREIKVGRGEAIVVQ
jgi:chromosome segregation ATPase